MAIVQPGSGDIPTVEDGLYTLRIIDTKQNIRQDDTFGKAGEAVLEVYCELADVLDDEGNAIVLRPVMALKFSQGGKYQPSTLYLYAKAAGVLPKEGQPFDTDLLEGRLMQGMVQQEEGKWPRIEPKSLMPIKPRKMGQVDDDGVRRNDQGAPSEARVPWESAEVAVDDLATWRTKFIDVGYTPAEIAGHSKAAYDRLPADLTPIEREELAKSLGV